MNIIFRDISSTFIRQVFSIFLQLILTIYIARSFGPEGNGLYTLSLLLPNFLFVFLNMGLVPANIYFINSKKINFKQSLKNTGVIYSVILIAGIIIGALFVETQGEFYFPGVSKKYLFLAIGLYPLLLAFSYANGFLHAYENFTKLNFCLVLYPLLNLIGVIISGFYASGTIFNFILINCTALFIATLFSLYYLKKLYQKRKAEELAFETSSTKLVEVMRYSLISHLCNISAFLEYKLDLILVNILINPFSAGVYAIATQMTQKIWIISQAVSTIFLPIFSKKNQLSNLTRGQKKMVVSATFYTFWITFFIGLGFALACEYIVFYLFGIAYKESVYAILALLPGTVIIAPSRILSNHLSGQGLPGVNLKISLIALGINIILNFILVPRFGISGAGIATSVSYSFSCVCKVIVYSKITSISCWQLFFSNFKAEGYDG